ncbi:MAG: FHA domain-containing protein [Firmicutes bacterium]|nr:FHA domain-containing protein [Bacillota bacterium]
MKFNNWVLPWAKRKGNPEQDLATGGDGTKVFARFKQVHAAQPAMALVVVAGPDYGREYLLAPMNVKIGRQAQNHIRLKDAKVSREHAVLQYQAKKRTFLLRDLGSTNGTFYNNCRISSTLIAPGGEIRLGETVLRVIALREKDFPEPAGTESS